MNSEDFKPALANSVEFTDLEPYVFSDNWTFEQKIDGVRLALHVKDGRTRGINRKGLATPVQGGIIRALSTLEGEWVLDGEWIAETLWVFDLPVSPMLDAHAPHHERRAALDVVGLALGQVPQLKMLPSHQTPREKVALMRWVVEHHAEGIMLKDGRQAYPTNGRRSSAMLKAKLVKTADCVITEVGREGKNSAAVGLFREHPGLSGADLVDVGSVKLTDEQMRTFTIGTVIEVAYLYCTDELRLYQPRIRGVRVDKSPHECTLDQLEFTDKSVLANRLP